MYLWLTLLLIFTNEDCDLILKYYNQPMTLANIEFAISETNIQFKKETLELIKRESGNLKSKLAIKGNNIFGMRKSRRNLAIGTIYGYSKYKAWIYSLLEMKYWQAQSPPKKNEDFKKYLRRRAWN